jgi:hypothetical protein
MSEQLRDAEYRADDRDNIDDRRTEDQAENVVQNVRFDRFDLNRQL